MNTGIYEIAAPSGHRYIGSAVNISRRWTRHRADLKAGYHGNAPLQRAAEKHGLPNLQFKLLLECRPEDLLFYEQALIDGLKPEYNIAPIAGNSLGVKRSEEFKRKVSAGLKGRQVSAETREKIGAKHKGKVISPAGRAAVSQANRLRDRSPEQIAAFRRGCHSPEAQQKRSLALAGRPVSDETRKKLRKSVAASWARRKQKA